MREQCSALQSQLVSAQEDAAVWRNRCEVAEKSLELSRQGAPFDGSEKDVSTAAGTSVIYVCVRVCACACYVCGFLSARTGPTALPRTGD
jgi:hypothetical protein